MHATICMLYLNFKKLKHFSFVARAAGFHKQIWVIICYAEFGQIYLLDFWFPHLY